jgi:hypothetical protein
MTVPAIGSFLIRLEISGDGTRSGALTSVQTGAHVQFADLAELARILERWRPADGGTTEQLEGSA